MIKKKLCLKHNFAFNIELKTLLLIITISLYLSLINKKQIKTTIYTLKLSKIKPINNLNKKLFFIAY